MDTMEYNSIKIDRLSIKYLSIKEEFGYNFSLRAFDSDFDFKKLIAESKTTKNSFIANDENGNLEIQGFMVYNRPHFSFGIEATGDYMYRDEDGTSQIYEVHYNTKDSDVVLEVLNKYKKEKDKVKRGKIKIVKMSSGEIYTDTYKIKSVEYDPMNYNDDFEPVRRYMENYISRDNGIIVLHGKAGTGKSYYIRSLMCSMDRDFIYMPPHMTSQLSSPSMIDFIIENKDAIFVIEDAEEVLRKQDNRNTAISNILNFSDGILGDLANVSFIFTFNMPIGDIDPAIRRKGRMIAEYEFDELTEDKRLSLCKRLGVECESGVLANIYGATDMGFDEKKRGIGFAK